MNILRRLAWIQSIRSWALAAVFLFAILLLDRGAGIDCTMEPGERVCGYPGCGQSIAGRMRCRRLQLSGLLQRA